MQPPTIDAPPVDVVSVRACSCAVRGGSRQSSAYSSACRVPSCLQRRLARRLPDQRVSEFMFHRTGRASAHEQRDWHGAATVADDQSMTTLESWNPLGILALLRNCEVQALLVLVAFDRPDVDQGIIEARRLEHLLDKVARHFGLTRMEQERVTKLAIALHRARLADRVDRADRLDDVCRRVLRTLGGVHRTDEEIQRWVVAIGSDTGKTPEVDPWYVDPEPPARPNHGGGKLSTARRKA